MPLTRNCARRSIALAKICRRHSISTKEDVQDQVDALRQQSRALTDQARENFERARAEAERRIGPDGAGQPNGDELDPPEGDPRPATAVTKGHSPTRAYSSGSCAEAPADGVSETLSLKTRQHHVRNLPSCCTGRTGRPRDPARPARPGVRRPLPPSRPGPGRTTRTQLESDQTAARTRRQDGSTPRGAQKLERGKELQGQGKSASRRQQIASRARPEMPGCRSLPKWSPRFARIQTVSRDCGTGCNHQLVAASWFGSRGSYGAG